jgi:hypothetical protein
MVLDEATHLYRDLDDPEREYVSVSGVIRRIGLAKSWTSVADDPKAARAIEFARERGKAVEGVLNALLRGEEPVVDVPAWISDYNGGETLRESVERFLPGAWNWLDTDRPAFLAAQEIVADPEAGIAGTLDLRLDGWVVDVKCTAKEELDWKIQVGAYRGMSVGEPNTAILHLNPKFRRGYIWRAYDADRCGWIWTTAREAWVRSLTEFANARAAIEALGT